MNMMMKHQDLLADQIQTEISIEIDTTKNEEIAEIEKEIGKKIVIEGEEIPEKFIIHIKFVK